MANGLYNGIIDGTSNGLNNGILLGNANGIYGQDSRPRIVTNGLYLYLDPGDRRSYPGTGSGSTILDLSGNSYTGTLTNGAYYNSFGGGCIVTDGINDVVTCPAGSLGSATSNYSFGGWYMCTDFANNKSIITRGRDGFGGGWSLTAYVGTDAIPQASLVYTVPSTVGIGCAGSIPVKLNTWFHIMGVWINGTSMTLYINGQVQNILNTTGSNLRASTAGWNLGSIGTTAFSSGNTGAVYVYNRALSGAEVGQNFNAHRKRYGI